MKRFAGALSVLCSFLHTQFRPILYVQLGDAVSALRESADAVHAYKAAIDLQPTYGEAHYRLGLLYFSLAEREPVGHHRTELGNNAKVCVTR